MRISILVFLLASFLANTTSHAQKQVRVDIKEATVFLRGAELTSTTNTSIPKGESEILFTNIAGNVNEQSLNIGASNGVVVQSATFQNNYLVDDNLSPRAQEIKDSIELVQNKRNRYNNELSVINEQVAILSQNRKVTGEDKGLSVVELQKMLDLVKNRMGALLNEKDALAIKVKDADQLIKKLNQQLQQEKNKGFQPGGQLLVKFYATKATTTNVHISYVVPNAGWTPTYDLRVDKINAPVQLFYKAHVYQNSGVSWNNVKLSLSTGNPNEGAQAPVMHPWRLAFYTPRPINYRNNAYNNGSGAGKYNADMAEAKSLSSYDREIAINEAAPSSINDFVQVDNSGIATSFDIDLPYTILSNGQKQTVAIKKHELPATYRYYAVPKIDRDAFLQAQVTDWEDLNLLPAQTNIFFEDTYVGQGYIDVRNVKDTMTLSLGRDKKVIIRRECEKHLRSERTIGTNVKKNYNYAISVRNTRNEPLNITLLDQIPISNDKDIVIEDKKYKGANYNETTGAVTWKLNIKANETQKLDLGFTVKYPKGKNINL
ncbi:MAG: DUF4139 domain-containing protein [Flavipsychrobacter sp.]